MSAKPYYDWLEVSKTATTQEIKRAYRRLALKYHPDKQDGFEQRFKEIAEAYEILGNEQRRKEFDAGGVADVKFKSSKEVFRECFGDDDAEEESTLPLIQFVSPQRIFNLPIYDHQSPIIDTRPADLFADGHVMESMNVPPGGDLCKFLQQFEADWSPDDYSNIVIIGLSEADEYTVFVAKAIERLMTDPVITSSESASDNLASLRKKLVSSARKAVLIMAGGATAFQAAYPGCYGKMLKGDGCQTPTHIWGNVFLGSREFLRGHALDHCVSAGIKRVIVPLGDDKYREGVRSGLDFFPCDVDYGDAETTMNCWNSCAEYIDSSTGRVLVILHNRHQSASAVLAWLVRGSPQMELRTAARLMRRECPAINWSLAFSEQFVEFDTDRKVWLNAHGVVVPAP